MRKFTTWRLANKLRPLASSEAIVLCRLAHVNPQMGPATKEPCFARDSAKAVGPSMVAGFFCWGPLVQ